MDSGLVCESVPASDLGAVGAGTGTWTRVGVGAGAGAGAGAVGAEAGTVGAEMAGGGAEAGARAEARMGIEAGKDGDRRWRGS